VCVSVCVCVCVHCMVGSFFPEIDGQKILVSRLFYMVNGDTLGAAMMSTIYNDDPSASILALSLNMQSFLDSVIALSAGSVAVSSSSTLSPTNALSLSSPLARALQVVTDHASLSVTAAGSACSLEDASTILTRCCVPPPPPPPHPLLPRSTLTHRHASPAHHSTVTGRVTV
jgi:hypothetical protein